MFILYGMAIILLIGAAGAVFEYIYKEEYPVPEQIEYSGFEELLAKLERVDSQAADWLRNADKKGLTWFNRSGNLIQCFPWKESPQGADYWCELSLITRDM